MELITTAPFNFKKLVGYSPEPSPYLWDRLSIEAGVTRGVASWQRNLRRLEQKYKKMQRDYEQISSLRTFMEKLQRQWESFPQRASWGKMVDTVEEFLLEFFREGEDRQTLLRNMGFLRSLEQLEDEVALSDALELMEKVIKEASLPEESQPKKGVTVAPLTSALYLPFQVVFMPGLLEQNYPSPFRPDPLLLEEERERMGGIPLRREDMQRQELHFLTALGASTDKLYLSYPRYGAGNGREQVPSHYLLQVAETLTGEHLTPEQLDRTPGFNRISSLAPLKEPEQAITPGEFDQAVTTRVSSDKLHEYLQAVQPWFSGMIQQKEAQWHPQLTPYQGVLRGEEAAEIFSRRYDPFGQVLSVSYLKGYASCPYHFFLERILQLTPWEEPEERFRLESLERGDLMHRALERFFREARQRELLPLWYNGLAEAQELWQTVLEETFREFEDMGVTGYPLLWKVDQELMQHELWDYLKKEAREAHGRTPYLFEFKFGEVPGAEEAREVLPEEKSWRVPVKMHLPSRGEDISFQGRIDRLDLGSDGKVKVIDYKTGKVRVKSPHQQSKISLQLSLYLRAACTVLQDKLVEKIFASYVYLSRSQGYPEATLDGLQWKQQEEKLQEVLDILIDSFSQGYFFPYPSNLCSYCSFVSVCGPDISREMEGKQEDTYFQAFQRAKEVLLDD